MARCERSIEPDAYPRGRRCGGVGRAEIASAAMRQSVAPFCGDTEISSKRLIWRLGRRYSADAPIAVTQPM